MPVVILDRWREAWLRQPVALPKPWRQRLAGKSPARDVLLISGSREIPAHNALDIDAIGAPGDHRATGKVVPLLWRDIQRIDVARHDVVGDDVLCQPEPELRDAGENLSLVRDRSRQDDVKCR